MVPEGGDPDGRVPGWKSPWLAGRRRRRKLGRKHARVFVLLVLIVVLAGGFAWAAKRVTVVVDGVSQSQFSLRLTVRGVLADAGITLHERDQVEPPPDEWASEGGTITIKRAFAVSITADGKVVESMTSQATVAAAVAEAGVALDADDRTEPPLDAAPTPGMSVVVVRVNKEYESALWRIPCKVTKREDETLALGVTKVVTQGKDGVEQVTFCTTFENGVQIARKITERVVVEEPVTETRVIGTSGTIVRDGETIHFRKAMSMTATAYCACPLCCGIHADGYTYLGLPATRGVIAVDPRVIPLWTRVYVEGYGHAIAADIGSAIKGNIIDVCLDDHAEADAWGRQKVMVYILP